MLPSRTEKILRQLLFFSLFEIVMNLAQRMKLLKHFGSLPPEPRPPLLVVPVSGQKFFDAWNASVHKYTVYMFADQGFVSRLGIE